jgi:hypothetical protein
VERVFWCYSPAIHVKPVDDGLARGGDHDTPISAVSGFLSAVKCFKTRSQNSIGGANHYKVVSCGLP